MYGKRVHAAVIAGGDRVSGATVHIVTEEYDAGPVLSRRQVEVTADDDAESLEAKVRRVERELLVDTLATLAKDGFPERSS
jgi:phosphoribosylglycinamide formyltransferase-1